MPQLFTLFYPPDFVAVEAKQLRDNFISLYTSNSGPLFGSTASALAGTLWWDTFNNELKVHNGIVFNPVVFGQDHGLLGDLGTDDHPQYLLTSGARTLTGDMAVTAGKKIDGLDLSKLVEGIASLEDMLLGGGFDQFETALTPAPPAWSLQGAPTLSTTTSTATGAIGRALSILPNAADEGIVQTVNVRPDRGFTLSFYSKADPVATSKVQITEVSPATGTTTVTFADSDWTFRTIGFTPSSIATQVLVRLLGNNGLVHYDDVQIYGGEIAPCYDLAWSDQDVIAENFQNISGVNFDLGLVSIQTGEAFVTFAGQSSLDKFVQFSERYQTFLTAQATIAGTPADEMLVRVTLADLVGMTLTIKTITGGTTAGNVRFYWDAKGVV